jgi:hypothetical protein
MAAPTLIEPLPTFETRQTGHWLFRGRSSRQTGSQKSLVA